MTTETKSYTVCYSFRGSNKNHVGIFKSTSIDGVTKVVKDRFQTKNPIIKNIREWKKQHD